MLDKYAILEGREGESIRLSRLEMRNNDLRKEINFLGEQMMSLQRRFDEHEKKCKLENEPKNEKRFGKFLKSKYSRNSCGILMLCIGLFYLERSQGATIM